VSWETLKEFLLKPENVEHIPEDDIVRIAAKTLQGQFVHWIQRVTYILAARSRKS
jgi:hypothetical protein